MSQWRSKNDDAVSATRSTSLGDQLATTITNAVSSNDDEVLIS